MGPYFCGSTCLIWLLIFHNIAHPTKTIFKCGFSDTNFRAWMTVSPASIWKSIPPAPLGLPRLVSRPPLNFWSWPPSLHPLAAWLASLSPLAQLPASLSRPLSLPSSVRFHWPASHPLRACLPCLPASLPQPFSLDVPPPHPSKHPFLSLHPFFLHSRYYSKKNISTAEFVRR